MNNALGTLIRSAAMAPSGDNMQPWQFAVDEAGESVTIFVDKTRDTSPMNAGQQMSALACGAALENIVQTARHNELEVEIHAPGDSSCKTSVHRSRSRPLSVEIPEFIALRHTNRRLYDGSSLSESVTSSWHDAVEKEKGIEIIWVTHRELLREFAIEIGRADAAMFGQRPCLKAFLANVRFDQPNSAAVEEGLCVGSLELATLERHILPRLKLVPSAFLRTWPMRMTFQKKAEHLINSSSGICLIACKQREAISKFRIGQVMQRVWLHLTQLGFCVQPMMSIPVLLNMQHSEDSHCEPRSEVPDERTRRLIGRLTENVPAALLRFGHGPAASARTGRRPVSRVVQAIPQRIDTVDHYCPANAGTIFSNSNVFNELR